MSDSENSAAKLLRKGWNGVLPVDLRAIGDHLGLEIKGAGMTERARVVRASAGHLCIEYNLKDNVVPRRFAVAHALGHIALGHEGMPPEHLAMFSTDAENPSERAANQFAMALLMPEDAVRKLVESGRFRNVADLAQAFKVSPVALSCRMTALYPSYSL